MAGLGEASDRGKIMTEGAGILPGDLGFEIDTPYMMCKDCMRLFADTQDAWEHWISNKTDCRRDYELVIYSKDDLNYWLTWVVRQVEE